MFRLCRWQWNAVKYRNEQGQLVDGRWRYLTKEDKPGAIPPDRNRFVKPDEPDRIFKTKRITERQKNVLLARRRSQRVVREV